MQTPVERAIDIELDAPARTVATPPCPVDRMPRRRRNRICVRIISVGLLNFLLYTVIYAALGGDAHNGECRRIVQPDGRTETAYFVRGHFIRELAGQEREVGKHIWVYSYVHSISVLITSAAMIISMLVLARPHIIATMRDGWISGQTFITVFGTMVVFVAIVAVITFSWDFASQLARG